ncbi:MAG: prephenate dehydrogenase/arogenate dehydrogenase family protein [Firmicutes bacterium]|nr:prephenate dehydrogenase/arogenate dehydrogenase family protein [Bacillota bacterium]
MAMFKKICILGLGLIGGSLARAISKRGLASHITGIDVDHRNLKEALDEGAIHSCGEIPGAFDGADLLILATPVDTTLNLISQIFPHLSPGMIVTDVASTKEKIVSRASTVLPDNVLFVGGHPMAGSEKSGFRNSMPNLFDAAHYFITPTEYTSRDAIEKIKSLVKAIGAVPLEITPGEHDQVVAILSHLPYLTATALVNILRDRPGFPDFLQLAAGGFKDTTRIASSNPIMWQQILHSNSEKIVPILDNFINLLQHYKRMLEKGDTDLLLGELKKAREVRDHINCRIKDE